MSRYRKAALDLLAQVRSRYEAQNVEEATCWVVESLDVEFGSTTLFGPFEDPVEAMKRASRHEREMNEGLDGSPGWKAKVKPVFPAGETKGEGG